MVAPLVMGAAISGGASLLGGVLGNRASARQARQQQQWQEHMRATQYQTSVADLQAAGLNPMLAYTQGGAGVPSGATARQEDVISPAVSSAMSTVTALQNLKAIQAQTEKVEQDTKVAKATELKTLEEVYMANRLARLYAYQGSSAMYKSMFDDKTLEDSIKAALSSHRQTQYAEPEAKAGASFYEALGAGGHAAKGLADLVPLFKFLLGRK